MNARDSVLIVGAGVAGLYLALKLEPRPTIVLSPGPLGQTAASTWAQGGLAAALAPDDSPALHADDTVKAGAGLVDPVVARLIADEGPARVISSADQLSEVQDGDILVAPVTAPSWGPIFGKIRATVTDIGGMMSHAAIVCREYGMPAVTGTGTASTEIRAGQLLRVDGNSGTVTILD